jgi:hypothetical protein
MVTFLTGDCFVALRLRYAPLRAPRNPAVLWRGNDKKKWRNYLWQKLILAA